MNPPAPLGNPFAKYKKTHAAQRVSTVRLRAQGVFVNECGNFLFVMLANPRSASLGTQRNSARSCVTSAIFHESAWPTINTLPWPIGQGKPFAILPSLKFASGHLLA
jgi:hypothetical protein